MKSVHQAPPLPQDPLITELVDTTDIAILPSLNPDGFSAARKGSCSGDRRGLGRGNARGVDIARNFPTLEDRREFLRRPEYDPYEGREPETAAMMSWAADNNFVLSLTLHDGSVGITYPFHQRYKHM